MSTQGVRWIMRKIHLTGKPGAPAERVYRQSAAGPVISAGIDSEKDECGEVQSLVSIAHDITASGNWSKRVLKPQNLNPWSIGRRYRHDFNNA